MADLNASALQKLRNQAKLGKLFSKYFTQGADGFSSSTMTGDFRTLMQAIGIPLPKDAVITLDVIQLALAGGAIVEDIQAGADVLMCVGDLANGVQGVCALLGELGLLPEPLKQVADFAGLTANAAAAIDSDGSDVLADIGCVLSLIQCVGDLAKDFTGTSEEAVHAAKMDLQSHVHLFISGQVAFASAQAKAFQAGQLDYWDFVGNVALNSPLEFKNFFPDLACYFPRTTTVVISGSGESDGLLGNHTDTESTSIHEMITTQSEVQAVLLKKFILDPLASFTQYYKTSPTISIEAMSVISMLMGVSPQTGPTEMNFNFDIIAAMRILGVTPSILGDDWAFKGFMKNENDLNPWKNTLPYPPLTLKPQPQIPQSGLVINNKPFYSAAQTAQIAATNKLVNLQLEMQWYDEHGDIDSLMKIPEAVAILKRWANIYIDPTYVAPHYVGSFSKGLKLTPVSISNMTLSPGKSPIGVQPWFDVNRPGDPRIAPYLRANYGIEISDYWKCLGVIASMEKSQLLGAPARALASKYGTLDPIMTLFHKAYSFVMTKNINIRARAALASNLKMSPAQLGSRLTPAGKMIFYKKAG